MVGKFALFFPMIGKFFPMVGKFRQFFPTIGKMFRRFSNDWKKFSRRRKGRKDCGRDAKDKQDKGGQDCGRDAGGERTATQGTHKNCQTIMTILDNFLETTWTTRDNF